MINKKRNTVKLTNWMRIFHPDEYLESLASYVLCGTLGIRDIPFQARVSRKTFYAYAFRHARGRRDLQLYDEALACLRDDLDAELTENSRWMLAHLYEVYRDGRSHLETDIYYLQRAQKNLRYTGRPH